MSEALSHEDFGFVRDLLRQRSAIALDDDKQYLVECRLVALAKSEGCGSVSTLIRRMRTRSEDRICRRVVELMTTNETSFFRDGHPFAALREHVLPELAARRAKERQLTLWCAACASGQEPYSVAIVLRELGLCAPQWRVRLLATDLSREMVERCKRGQFSAAEVDRGLSPTLRDRYFRRTEGGLYEARGGLKVMIEFAEANLCGPWPLRSNVDIIFMRNVLIYFDVNVKKQMLSRARAALKEDGALFLGAGETVLGLASQFQTRQFGKAQWFAPAPGPLVSTPY